MTHPGRKGFSLLAKINQILLTKAITTGISLSMIIFNFKNLQRFHPCFRTVTGAGEPKWRNALDSIQSMFRGPSSTNMIEKNLEMIGLAAAPAAGKFSYLFMLIHVMIIHANHSLS